MLEFQVFRLAKKSSMSGAGIGGNFPKTRKSRVTMLVVLLDHS